jgi:hypothetical protein
MAQPPSLAHFGQPTLPPPLDPPALPAQLCPRPLVSGARVSVPRARSTAAAQLRAGGPARAPSAALGSLPRARTRLQAARPSQRASAAQRACRAPQPSATAPSARGAPALAAASQGPRVSKPLRTVRLPELAARNPSTTTTHDAPKSAEKPAHPAQFLASISPFRRTAPEQRLTRSAAVAAVRACRPRCAAPRWVSPPSSRPRGKPSSSPSLSSRSSMSQRA